MVPITFCTRSDGRACAVREPDGRVTDANPRSCESLTLEVSQLIDVVHDALAESCAMTDIMSTQDPTPEIIEAAANMAVALFLGRRALLEGLGELQRRHPDRPAFFLGAQLAAEMETARLGLVHALVDVAERLIA